MADYLNDLIVRSGIDPIFLGWVGSLCVLWVINWLRGGRK
jgi:hypothetical protein